MTKNKGDPIPFVHLPFLLIPSKFVKFPKSYYYHFKFYQSLIVDGFSVEGSTTESEL